MSPTTAEGTEAAEEPTDPLVSVIVPTYYRNDRLEAALESVRRQTYRETETIVIDGTDEGHAEPVVTESSMTDVTYLLQRNHQDERLDGVNAVAAARDIGVDHASGEYVRFLDDDDRLREDAIERQLSLARDGGEVGVVYCGMVVEDGGPERMPSPTVRGDVLEDALRLQVAPCVPSTMLVETSLFDSIPPMRRLPHDDASLLIELAQLTRFDFVDEPLVVRGDPEDSLQSSLSSLAGRKETIAAYSDLYRRFPPDVERTALGRVYLQEGVLALQQGLWSWEAVKAFSLANYYTPDVNATFLCALAASLLGRPGWLFGTRLYKRFRGGTDRGGTGVSQ